MRMLSPITSRPRVLIIGAVLATAAAAASSCVVGDDPGGIADLGSSSGTGDHPLNCDMPRPGCPCAEDGVKVVCGEAVSKVGGQIVCGRGVSTCSGGVFDECMINGSVTLSPGTEIQTLGGAVECTDPCDPYCFSFNDDPTGEGNPDAGIVEGNGGITLPGDGGTTPLPNCTGGTSGTCAHSICEAGGALAVDCDGAPTAPPSPPPATPVTVFYEEFANNAQGWSLGPEWQIGPATQSWGQWYGYPDPGQDASPSNNDGVAGVQIGGNANMNVHGWYFLTSPAIDLSGKNAPAELSYYRWLNSDWAPWYMDNIVQIYNGSSWVTMWQGDTIENQWAQHVHDISNALVSNFRVRFGFRINSWGVWRVSSWNLDEVTITAANPPGPPPPTQVGGSCVTDICAVDSSCCTTAWTQSCVAMVQSVCGVTCQCDDNGAWVACYQDAFDHDGDGFASADGDCLDCDPNQNPGAYDFPANGIDEDCSGTIDDEPETCDSGIAMATSNPFAFARAIDLCSIAPQAQPTTAKKWGVLDAKLVQADGNSPPHTLSHGALSQFGTNTPYKGARMAVFSSGTARAPGDPGYVNPSGQFASFNQGKVSAYPPGFPANAQGCPTGWGNANDSSGLKLTIRVPTNAKSFLYNFHFFSSEYPEWVCTAYNDHFVAILGSNQTNGNISFDSNGDPVSVNIAFFTVPGCPTCNSPILTGTGFNGSCWGQICGGSTDWLFTTAPVDPGETITMLFNTWDMSDHVWDSTVLIDNWTWSVNTATVQTGQQPPPPPPTTYTDGYFIRDYDASGVCPPGTNVVWGHWSWQTSTPSDSYVDFFVRTATTLSGLDTAPEDAILFTDPPGPAALKGSDSIAQASPIDTQIGAAVVDETLMTNSRPRNQPFVRVVSHLAPSSDQLQAPTLLAWNLQFDCLPNQ